MVRDKLRIILVKSIIVLFLAVAMCSCALGKQSQKITFIMICSPNGIVRDVYRMEATLIYPSYISEYKGIIYEPRVIEKCGLGKGDVKMCAFFEPDSILLDSGFYYLAFPGKYGTSYDIAKVWSFRHNYVWPYTMGLSTKTLEQVKLKAN